MKKSRKKSLPFWFLHPKKNAMSIFPEDSGTSDQKGSDLSELTLLSKKEIMSESTDWSETKTKISEDHPSNTSWSEFPQPTTAGHNDENTAWSEFPQPIIEERYDDNTSWSQFPQPTTAGHYDDNTALSEFPQPTTAGYYDENTTWSEIPQLTTAEHYDENRILSEMTEKASEEHDDAKTALSEFPQPTTEGHFIEKTAWSEFPQPTTEGHFIENTVWSEFPQSTTAGHHDENTTLSEMVAKPSEEHHDTITAWSKSQQPTSEGHYDETAAWSEFTQSTTEGHYDGTTDWSEVTALVSEEHPHITTEWKEVTGKASEEHHYTNTAWSEFTQSTSDGIYYGNTALSEFTTTTYDEHTNANCDMNELENEIYAEATNKIIMDQLSRLDDGDEDVHVLSSLDGNRVKKVIRAIVTSLAFRIFGILLIFVDVSFVLIDLIIENKLFDHVEYRLISLAIALFFFMDVVLRLYVEGIRPYFADIVNSLDASIIVVTLLINVIYMFYDYSFLNDIPRITILFRPLRFVILIRILHLANQKRQLEKATRRMVSGNKRRYRKDGFDLDLTYVTERIIAMSFPSSGRQSFYRNPIEEVVRFLDTKHPNHYRVYNLCSERAYDPRYFHYNVRRILIDDHNVPPLSEMVAFSKEIEEWLNEDVENIVAIHCKGGKGRTGTMVCVCLMTLGIFVTAEESLFYFGERRTDKSSSAKFQGVETPSQNRYVGYFADVKNIYRMILPPRKVLRIKKICLYSVHGVGKGNGSDLKVQIIMQQKIVFFCSTFKNCRIFHDSKKDRVIIKLLSCPPLYDDVKVQFHSSNLPKYYDNCPFFFWFHTSFIENNRLYLSRNELDNLHKPRVWKIYPPEFAVELYFDNVH